MRFEVRALGGDGTATTVALDGADESDARAQAAERGLVVLSVRQGGGERGTRRARGGHFSLSLFSQELLALLRAGLTLVEALETLAEKETHSESRRILDDILAALHRGEAFSLALARHPAIFPALYVALARASERTGDLEPSLTRYVAYANQLASVRRKVISSAIYPALLLCVGLLVTLFLLGYVVPRFSAVFEESGHELPMLSALLIAWGRFVADHGAASLAVLIVAVGAPAYALTRADGRRRMLKWLARLPMIGERLALYELARFYRTVGMLLEGGIPVVRALAMAANLLSPDLRSRLSRAERRIREGVPVSAAFEHAALTTPVASRMLRVGERSGRMGEMMQATAAFYDEDMARWVDAFTRTFEPLLMALIGVIIGGIVVLLYLPVFELAGSIQ
jgi:general secretion pathway protein F